LSAEAGWSKLSSMKKIMLVNLVLISLSASAEIYQGTGSEGERIYSDRPTKNSKVVELKGSSSYKPPKYRASTPNGKAQQEPAPFSYKVVTVVQPENNATLFYSDGPVTVALNLEPRLREADKIQIYIDGRSTGKPLHATSFSLTLEDRGSHELLAEVKSSAGKVVGKSKPVKFYFRKHSVLFKKPKAK
jgi:hypothetical protein